MKTHLKDSEEFHHIHQNVSQEQVEHLWSRGIIPIIGTIGGNYFHTVLEPLERLIQSDDKNLDSIHLVINSGGGDPAWIAPTIYLISKSHKPVIGVVSDALSAAFVIAVACHHRVCYPTSVFMNHQTQLHASGNSRNVSSYASALSEADLTYDKFIAQQTDIPPELLQEKSNEEWWIGAEEAKKLGIVDEILDLDYVIERESKKPKPKRTRKKK